MTDTADRATVRAESRYASRKWLFALLLVAVAVGMELADKLSPTLADFLKWIAGLYFGFNVGQQAASWIATALSTKKETSQ
jgi:hypothetical protein